MLCRFPGVLLGFIGVLLGFIGVLLGLTPWFCLGCFLFSPFLRGLLGIIFYFLGFLKQIQASCCVRTQKDMFQLMLFLEDEV